jgi:predicted phage terminase large subunit-like protein
VSLELFKIDPADELEHLEAEACRRSFRRFARRAWQEIDPAPLVWGWHLDAITEHLQAVAQRQIQRLLINIPPGHAKSNIVSVLYPAWRWAREPWWRVMTASYEMGLATRDAVKSRELIEGRWFQRHFARDCYGQSWHLSGDQNVKSYYANDQLGFRLCLSVGGKGTGYRGDALIVDDPHNALEADSKLARETVIKWKTATMSSRFNDQENAEEIVIMQRLHEDDLAGFLLSSDKGKWTHLCLPSEFEPKRRCVTFGYPLTENDPGDLPIADKRAPKVELWRDPRKREGELLFPAKFSPAVLAEAKDPITGMGELAFAGQHQQRPTPAAGGLIQRKWFARRWHYPGSSLDSSASLKWFAATGLSDGDTIPRMEYDPTRAQLPHRVIVTDATFKDTKKSDKVAIGVFDLVGVNLLQIDCAWGRMGLIKTVQSILDLRRKWPGVIATYIEDKANGPAVIEVLKDKVPGLIALEPKGSKEARISAASPFIQAGNVWLGEHDPDAARMIDEAASFPKGTNDDWIDMLAYAVLMTLSSSDAGWLERFVSARG